MAHFHLFTNTNSFSQKFYPIQQSKIDNNPNGDEYYFVCYFRNFLKFYL